MKGHLDTEQLKSMKYEDLQALAKDMDVSAGGKKEEIIARIAAVELEVSEDELTDEEKAAFEAEKAEAEEAKKAAARQEFIDNIKSTTDVVKVKVITRFLDKQLNKIKDTGEVYKVSRERAAELLDAGVAEIIE